MRFSLVVSLFYTLKGVIIVLKCISDLTIFISLCALLETALQSQRYSGIGGEKNERWIR